MPISFFVIEAKERLLAKLSLYKSKHFSVVTQYIRLCLEVRTYVYLLLFSALCFYCLI